MPTLTVGASRRRPGSCRAGSRGGLAGISALLPMYTVECVNHCAGGRLRTLRAVLPCLASMINDAPARRVGTGTVSGRRRYPVRRRTSARPHGGRAVQAPSAAGTAPVPPAEALLMALADAVSHCALAAAYTVVFTTVQLLQYRL